MHTTESRPTYQQALRAIGRYFDQNVYRLVHVSEVDDGYSARAFPGQQGYRKEQGIALPLRDVLALMRNQEQRRGAAVEEVTLSPLCPTGYADFFRSLGFDLDAAGATNVHLVELSLGFMVSYTVKGRHGLERAQELYNPPRINELLTAGYHRRAKPAPPA